MSLRVRLHRWVEGVFAPGARSRLAADAGDLLGAPLGGEAIIDVGCGFGSPLIELGLRPIGVDVDEMRVRVHPAPAIVADAAALPFADDSFAASFSFGLLHHLADASAQDAIGEMSRVVGADGLVVVFDGVLPETGRPLAALIRALDRGRHMRSEHELVALFSGASDWCFQRVTYTATGLEGVWCIRRPAE